MDPFQSLLTWFLLGALFCGGMPLFGGALLYHGLQRHSAGEFPLRKCIKCFFIAAGVAYLLMMLLGRWMPEIGSAAALAFAYLASRSRRVGPDHYTGATLHAQRDLDRGCRRPHHQRGGLHDGRVSCFGWQPLTKSSELSGHQRHRQILGDRPRELPNQAARRRHPHCHADHEPRGQLPAGSPIQDQLLRG